MEVPGTDFFVATDDEGVKRELREALPDAKLIFHDSETCIRDRNKPVNNPLAHTNKQRTASCLLYTSAVPLFYMVSGALLLGKNESFGELARKRILRIVAVIVIFSLLYYLKFAVRGQASVSPIRFPVSYTHLDCWNMYIMCD